jgi:hypothetical protein
MCGQKRVGSVKDKNVRTFTAPSLAPLQAVVLNTHTQLNSHSVSRIFKYSKTCLKRNRTVYWTVHLFAIFSCYVVSKHCEQACGINVNWIGLNYVSVKISSFRFENWD